MQSFLAFLLFSLCLTATLLIILAIRYWQSREHFLLGGRKMARAFAKYREMHEDSAGTEAVHRSDRQVCASCHAVIERDARSLVN